MFSVRVVRTFSQRGHIFADSGPNSKVSGKLMLLSILRSSIICGLLAELWG